ncbi:MAG: oligopeptide/dipeptide ABC transporter ATP-binding protein [Acidimicrobiales bacterium]
MSTAPGPGVGTWEEAPSPGGTPVLLVEQLATHYPVRRGLVDRVLRRPRRTVRAVDGVSLRIEPGELVALVGESGCGKTTTVLTVLGALRSTSGRVEVNGVDVTHMTHRELRPVHRDLQMIYQDPYESLDPRFRIRQTVEEPLLVHHIGGSRSERRQMVSRALGRAGLSPAELYMDRFPHELSGGQRQRAAIAAALILNPKLLLADEPVSMLDVSVRTGVLKLLDELRRSNDMAVVMVTHDLSTAGHFADRIIVMYLGRVVEEGPARDVLRRPQHPYTKALLSVVPSPDPRLRSTPQVLSGETPNPVDVPAGCRFHPRCPIAQDRCRLTDPELERPSADTSPGHRVACLLA